VNRRLLDSTDRRTRLLAIVGWQYMALASDAARAFRRTRRPRFVVLALSCVLATISLVAFAALVLVMAWASWRELPARDLVGAAVLAALANLVATIAAEALDPRDQS
jgi:hypothetical protein